MSVAKVIEITATSDDGFEDAIEKGIAKAGETIKGVKGAWISEQKVEVNSEGKVEHYLVNMRLTFVLD